MSDSKELIGIVSDDSKILIDPMFIIEADLSSAELKLILYMLNEQLNSQTHWVKLNSKEIAKQLKTSEVSLARWQKKLESSNLLEHYGKRSLLWRIPRRFIRKIQIPVIKEEIKDLTLEELKNELIKIQGKSVVFSERHKGRFIFDVSIKEFDFHQTIENGYHMIIIGDVKINSETHFMYGFPESDVTSSKLILSYDTKISIVHTDGSETILSDFR